ncbi:MAG: nucleotidyltransferase family protein [Dehalococcoidia bacterium]|nr:nucleotidyltransferase family protein [Dehalococcoidia bacterium]
MYALTIAGGRGERLKPFTDTVPKAMTPVNGRPILEYQVRWMRSQGVTDVVFLTGYLSETIRTHFGGGDRYGIRAHYSHEDQPLGRGGALRQGLSMVPDGEETVLVTNGDTLTDLDLAQLLAIHRKRDAMATLMLTRHPSQFGLVRMGDDDMVVEFAEKGPLPLWINAGVYLFNTAVEPLLPEIGDHEVSTFPQLAGEKRLAALPSDAMWLTVDSAKDLREVSERLADWNP